MSRVRPAGGAWRSAWSLAALLYVFVLATSPLLHHDVSCELKSRTHCTTCVSGVSGPGLAQASELPVLEWPRAGFVTATRDASTAAPCARALKGRSPPAA